jgi:hypothetical protein
MREAAILCLALLWLVQPALADNTSQRVIIDLHAPRAEIRAALLKHTPLGSRIGYVMEFIAKRLEPHESGSAITAQPTQDASRPRVAKTIRVFLGQYYQHIGAVFLTAPMVVHEEVSAQWLFDQQGRLIDVVVEKQARVY